MLFDKPIEPEQAKAPAMQPEQAADLASLQAGAAGAAAPVTEQASGEGQGQEIKPPTAAAMQIAGLAVGMLRPIVCYAVPTLAKAPDELWAPVPEGLAAVLDEMGANADWMQSTWARFALSVTPLAAFAAMEAMKEEPKPKAVAVEAPAAPAAGSDKVVFGDPVPVPQ